MCCEVAVLVAAGDLADAGAVGVHVAADDVGLAQHLAGLLAGAGGHEGEDEDGAGVGDGEVLGILVGEVVGDEQDGGRGDDHDQHQAGDLGEGSGADGGDAEGEQGALRLGTMCRYQTSETGMRTKEGTSQRVVQRRQAGLEGGLRRRCARRR